MDNKSKLESVVNSLKTNSPVITSNTPASKSATALWRLLYQPKPEEVSNMEIYDPLMRQFAEGAEISTSCRIPHCAMPSRIRMPIRLS